MHEASKFPIFSRIIQRVWLQSVILAVLLSGHVLLEFVPETQKHPDYEKILAFFATWVAAWLTSRIVSVFRDTSFMSDRLAPNIRPLVFVFTRVIIYSLAAMIALESLGVSITPLLASLGVGSLAVGLALQDTLGNLFSGFYLYVDRPIAIGDWIRLESGLEGQVVEIGWRSTHLLLPQQNMVVIPNSKLSTSPLTNFSLPAVGTTLALPLGVAYEMDLDKVERVLLEVARRVAGRTPGSFEGDGQPSVRFTKFGESSIDLSLGVRVRAYPDIAGIRHELIKEIQRTFAKEAIEIPYPKRVIQQIPVPQPAH
jgi:small-conductance mechanosensitive channel